MKIPFVKQDIELSTEDFKVIKDIIDSGRFCKGKYINALEMHFIKKCKVKYAVACCNATQGLVLAFKAMNIKNNRVSIPSFTWPSTLYAIECSGNTPVWADIDIDTWNIEPNFIEKSTYYDQYLSHEKWLSSVNEVEAAIPVDIFGNTYHKTSSTPTICDAAHSYGTKYLGNRYDIEVVSLSFTKPITAMQGGIILTNNHRFHAKIRELVDLTAKMCEINAYIALKEIEKFDERSKIRMGIIDTYRSLIGVPFKEQKVDVSSSYSTYSILFETTTRRYNVEKVFRDNGVEVKIYYEPLVRGLKNTDDVYSRIISLPTYPKVEKHVPFICKLINEA